MRPCLIHACHAPTMPFFSRPQHGSRETAVLCCGLEKNGMVGAWHGRGMASMNQTRPHRVNQMGKTHSKPLAARHGRGTPWARHAMCESAFTLGQEVSVDTETWPRTVTATGLPVQIPAYPSYSQCPGCCIETSAHCRGGTPPFGFRQTFTYRISRLQSV